MHLLTTRFYAGGREISPFLFKVILAVTPYCYAQNCAPGTRQMLTFSSFPSMLPLPSVSNRSKASRISCCCSSLSSSLGLAFFLWDAAPSEGFLKPEALARQDKSKAGSGRAGPAGQRPPQPPAHTAGPGPLRADSGLPRSAEKPEGSSAGPEAPSHRR